jgi:hypothetical protein
VKARQAQREHRQVVDALLRYEPAPVLVPDTRLMEMIERVKALQAERSQWVARERARCLKIAEQFPDNLMAQHIAKLIRQG